MAGAVCLYYMICYLKTVLFGIFCQQGYQIIILKLYDVTTLVTNKQLRVVLISAAAVTEDEAVFRFNLMNKALLEQKVQRPVYRRRLGLRLTLF